MGWNGVAWNGMDWNGMEWNGCRAVVGDDDAAPPIGISRVFSRVFARDHHTKGTEYGAIRSCVRYLGRADIAARDPALCVLRRPSPQRSPPARRPTTRRLRSSWFGGERS